MAADIAYLAIVGAGAVALAIEANRQFARPAEEFSYDRYPILRGVEPASLSTPGEHRRGYVFYILCYLAIYLLLLASDTLRNLLAETATGQKVAGATGLGIEGEVAPFASSNLAMPIYLSAAIIALLSTGVAAKAELAVRGFAYRLAGIPRGVYRIITRLNQLKYADVVGEHGSALEWTFGERIDGYASTPLTDELVDETREALRQIDLFAPSVTGAYGTRFWPRENVVTLDKLIQVQQASMSDLRTSLQALTPADDLQAFHLKALDTRNNLQALFAILFIRNKNVYLPSDHNPTAKIVKGLRQAERTPPLSHRLAAALLWFFALFLVASFLIDFGYQHWLANQGGLPQSWHATLNAQARAGSVEAVFRALGAAVLFGSAAAVAVMVRENRLESEDWTGNWRLNQIPTMDFIRATAWPVIVALIAMFVWQFLSDAARSWFETGSFPTEQIIVAIVRSMVPFFFYYAPFAFVIALFVYVLADQHARLHASRTLLIGLGAAVIYGVVAVAAVGSTYGFPDGRDSEWTYKEMALQAAPALFFFLALAILLEWSEGDA